MDKQLNGELGELHALEIELLKRIRKQYRYGEITIILHNGLPQKIKEVIRYEDLKS